MKQMYCRVLKNLCDRLAAAVVLVAVAPVLVLVALVIRLSLGSPILFRQIRIGLGGEQFTMVKFRTMGSSRDLDGKLLPDNLRLTRMGTFLRATSLDELPQLWNVLKGEMSLVGPRPLLPQYLPLYSKEQRRRHLVKPGVTGWAQVNGRNALTWDEKFSLDVWYVDRCSLRLDLVILAMTARKVFSGDGISFDGHATMPAFSGRLGDGPRNT